METKNPKRNRTKQNDGASKDAAKSRGKRGSISATELAFLAALLCPEDCKRGNSASALRHALALFMESDELVRSCSASLTSINELSAFAGDTPGGKLFFDLWSARVLREHSKALRLESDERLASDEVRDYLSEHCDLDKKKGAKSWGKVRTVWDNFRRMFISIANDHNTANKDSIAAAEKLTAKLNAESGGNDDSSLRYHREDERWRDGEAEFEAFKRRAARYDPTQPLRFNPCEKRIQQPIAYYEIDRGSLDALIRWKRIMKQKGGIKAIKQWTRLEVLGPIKKNNPKKKK